MTSALTDRPAEEDVAGGLQPTLAVDDPLAVAPGRTLAEEALIDRCLGLLRLEQERVAVVGADVQEDEGAQAHAADPDDLEGEVGHRVPIQEDSAIFLEGLPVSSQRPFGDR